MIKNFIKVAAITSLLLSSSVFANELIKSGEALKNNKFTLTGIAKVDQVRTPIRASFEASVDIYKQYLEKAKNSTEYNQFYKSVEGKSDKEIEASFNALPAETKVKIQTAQKATKEINKSIGKLLLQVAASQIAFSEMDTDSALSDLSMWDMPAALSSVSDTTSELGFIKESVGEIYRINQILSKFQQAS